MAPETPIQVLDIGVEGHAQYTNDPSLCLLLDRQPEYGRYDKRPCAQEMVSGEQAAIIGSRMRNERKGWHLGYIETPEDVSMQGDPRYLVRPGALPLTLGELRSLASRDPLGVSA